jgi:hypothetical protein
MILGPLLALASALATNVAFLFKQTGGGAGHTGPGPAPGS